MIGGDRAVGSDAPDCSAVDRAEKVFEFPNLVSAYRFAALVVGLDPERYSSTVRSQADFFDTRRQSGHRDARES